MKFDLHNRPGLAAVCGAAIALLGQNVFTSTFTDIKAVFMERAAFPMIEQRIEVVRRAAAASSCPIPVADQAIISQVMEWNLRIVHEQEANRQWYADIFSTDRWNAVQEIPLPCEVLETRK